MFSFITMNWKAQPLISYRVIVDLISATTTKTGLTVRCELDTNAYPKGIVVSDREIADINITRDAFHGEWNYTILPRDRSIPPQRRRKEVEMKTFVSAIALLVGSKVIAAAGDRTLKRMKSMVLSASLAAALAIAPTAFAKEWKTVAIGMEGAKASSGDNRSD